MKGEEWVEILTWPTDAGRLAAAQHEGRPALLLIESGDDPPSLVDPLCDWVRVGTPQRDVQSRLDTLVERLRQRSAFDGEQPVVDDTVVRYGSQVVVLSPVEARLIDRLLEDGRAVVSREALIEHAWGADEPDRNTVDVAMARLRRKVEPVGIVVRTIRSRGFLVELAGPEGSLAEPDNGLSGSGQQAVSNP